jgi:hypothetical protein
MSSEHVFRIGAPGLAGPAGKIDLSVEGVSGANISDAELAFVVSNIARGREQGWIAWKRGE